MSLPPELLREIQERGRRVDQEIRAALPSWGAKRNQVIRDAIKASGGPEPTLEELVAMETHLRAIKA